MPNRREFLSRLAAGGVGFLSIPGLVTAHGFRRRSNGCCVPVWTCPTRASSCGCPIQFNGQIDDTYYYYCVTCGVNGQNTGGHCGAYDGTSPSGSSSLAHFLEPPTIQCASCEPPTGNCIPRGMNRDWMVMCLGGFPTQVNSYAGKGKDKDNKAHNGATNKADSFSWDITKVAKGVKVKIDRPYADSSPPDTGWYVDERGKKQDYIVGVKLWSVSSSWTDENGILITTLPMLVGMEVDNYDKGPSALLYQLDRDEHHHHIYSTRGVFSVLTWKGNTN